MKKVKKNPKPGGQRAQDREPNGGPTSKAPTALSVGQNKIIRVQPGIPIQEGKGWGLPGPEKETLFQQDRGQTVEVGSRSGAVETTLFEKRGSRPKLPKIFREEAPTRKTKKKKKKKKKKNTNQTNGSSVKVRRREKKKNRSKSQIRTGPGKKILRQDPEERLAAHALKHKQEGKKGDPLLD